MTDHEPDQSSREEMSSLSVGVSSKIERKYAHENDYAVLWVSNNFQLDTPSYN